MRKITALLLCVLLLTGMTGCASGKTEELKMNQSQKVIGRVSLYDELNPKKTDIPDYNAMAQRIDNLLYTQKEDGGLSVFWQDDTYQSFGLPSYAGDHRTGKAGAEEAVATMASVLSATLLGIDKSNQNGVNYVSQLECYFQKEEQIVTNNPGGRSVGYSMWYILYPSILFTEISMQYPEQENIRTDCLEMIAQWYQAGSMMQEQGNFNYTGFDFSKMEPYSNGIWTEPDSAAGIAVLMYLGYELTEKEEYLELCKACINYCEEFYGSSYYEILLCYAPYIAAKMNAEYNTDYSLDNLFGDIFDGNAIPRGGWGQVIGTWGDYCVNGLMGSTTDRGGYAFAMNTFATAYILSPVAKYDTRYASALGEWYLNVAANSKYFFYDYVERDNTSVSANEVSEAAADSEIASLPFEGIRKSHDSKTPWFGGDAVECDWALTDFSIYSGAHLGMLAAVTELTDVEGILKIDCNVADYSAAKLSTYLIYNPYQDEKTINYHTSSETAVDLYDSVSGQYVSRNVSGTHELPISGKTALVLVELPAGTELIRDGRALYAGDTFVSSDCVNVRVTNLQNNDTVRGTFQVELGCFVKNQEDEVVSITVQSGEDSYEFDTLDGISLEASKLGAGSRTLTIRVITRNGMTDETTLRLKIEG